MEAKTYQIRRFYFDDTHPEHNSVIAGGLTLDEAQAHCKDESTLMRDATGQTIWFDGFTKEET